MRNKSLLLTFAIMVIAMSNSAQEKGAFTDSRDGKIYKTVTIGTQTWMAENLAFKTENGCYAYNREQGNVAKYGYLYDCYKASSSCPKGWHLPSDAEWTALTKCLGGEDVAGGKMKSATGWNSPNTGATNTSGFSALPGGASGYSSTGIGTSSTWWSSSLDHTDPEGGEMGDPLDFYWCRALSFSVAKVSRLTYDSEYYCYVRCIKD